MKKFLFDVDHLKDYTFYGLLSGIFFSISVWFFLYNADYKQTWIMYGGSAFFTFIVMLYLIKASQNKDENLTSKMMIFAGHLMVVAGIIMSVFFCLILIHDYKSEYLAAQNILMPSTHGNTTNLLTLFLPALLVNLLSGSFISLMSGYLIKWNHPKSKVAGDLY